MSTDSHQRESALDSAGSTGGRALRVTSLQPFYGGSHRQWIDAWIASSRHQWQQLTLPDRHWKWRMRHSAIWFSEQLNERPLPDVLVTTDMTNVAELRGLLSTRFPRVPPIVLYMHENQLAYPNRWAVDSPAGQRDQHFAFTNLVSVLAANQTWFNSAFNRTSMIEGLRAQAERWPDHVPVSAINSIECNSVIEPPGIHPASTQRDAARQARIKRAAAGEPLRILWAARWEHDKNPGRLLECLRSLAEQSIPFSLSVIGQQFRQVPEALVTLQREFRSQIRHCGWQPDRGAYARVLDDSDVLVSTADHEFFGIAAAESIAAGLYPVLPDRLAYPELLSFLLADPGESLPADCLYAATPSRTEAQALASQLQRLDRRRRQHPQDWLLPNRSLEQFAGQLDWKHRAAKLDRRLQEVFQGPDRP